MVINMKDELNKSIFHIKTISNFIEKYMKPKPGATYDKNARLYILANMACKDLQRYLETNTEK